MAESCAATNQAKRPWTLTAFGAVGIIAMLVLPVLPLFKDAESMPELARFIGHFHPLVLHLPIGVFILVLLQEIGGCIKGRKVEPCVGFPLAFGVWSSIAAVIAGYLLMRSGADDYAGETANRHMWGGVIFTAAVIATAVLKKWVGVMQWKAVAYKLPLVASVAIMGFASHDGGSMTHGSDFLTKHAPGPLKMLLGGGADDKGNPDDPLLYAGVIEPIFERRCMACHKEGKSKGGLRMDSYELLVKGGKEGPALVAGDSAKSNIIKRMLLPLEDEEHMPPEGKPQVEEQELMVIKWWIDQGADSKVRLADVQLPQEIEAVVAELIKLPPASQQQAGADPQGHAKPDKALQAEVAKLSGKYPGTLSFESQQSTGVVLSAVSLRAKLGDGEFAEFTPLIPHLVSADLSATSIGDSSVTLLKDAAGLSMLRLSQTKVTDEAMKVVAALSELESLNLYGTEVSDEGLMQLASLPKLKRLYLWQTKVTPEGIEKFKTQVPFCEVILGAE